MTAPSAAAAPEAPRPADAVSSPAPVVALTSPSPDAPSSEAPVVALIHGAWAASWVWQPIVPALEAKGYDVVLVDLPGSDEPEERSTIENNVEAVCAAVAGRTGPLYLVGHSGGGITVSAAGEALAERVAGLVYVAGILLPSGVAFDTLRDELDTIPDHLGVAPFLEPALGGAGTVVPADAAAAVLFHRASAADAVAAARRLQPQWNAGLDIVPTWTSARFGRLRRLYIETMHDRDLPLPLQWHMQARTPGGEMVHLSCDHAPQLSAPTELVAAIAGFIEGAPASAAVPA